MSFKFLSLDAASSLFDILYEAGFGVGKIRGFDAGDFGLQVLDGVQEDFHFFLEESVFAVKIGVFFAEFFDFCGTGGLSLSQELVLIYWVGNGMNGGRKAIHKVYYSDLMVVIRVSSNLIRSNNLFSCPIVNLSKPNKCWI